MHWSLCKKQEKPKPGTIPFPLMHSRIGDIEGNMTEKTLCLHHRYAGYGRRSSQQKTNVFRDSWTMYSTNPVESCVMSVCLERAMLAPADLVSRLISLTLQ